MKTNILTALLLVMTVAGLLPAKTLAVTGNGPATAALILQISAQDPAPGTLLATGDRLSLRIAYQSQGPVRFVAQGFRQGVAQSGAVTSSTPPYPAGRGEALAWLLYNQPLHIDEIRVTAYDLAWAPLGTLTQPLSMTWQTRENAPPREPADWVASLAKSHRRVFDSSYDPQPEQPHPVFDFFFIVCFLAIPGYLLMQGQMLFRYRGLWQWYAAAPLLPLIPLGLYSLLGLGLSTDLWVVFLFRYLAVAFLYLLILWTVVRARERRHRLPPKPPIDAVTGGE